jgi:hypothetical protein
LRYDRGIGASTPMTWAISHESAHSHVLDTRSPIGAPQSSPLVPSSTISWLSLPLRCLSAQPLCHNGIDSLPWTCASSHDRSSLPIKKRESPIDSQSYTRSFPLAAPGMSFAMLPFRDFRPCGGQEGPPSPGRGPCRLLTCISRHVICAVPGADWPHFISGGHFGGPLLSRAFGLLVGVTISFPFATSILCPCAEAPIKLTASHGPAQTHVRDNRYSSEPHNGRDDLPNEGRLGEWIVHLTVRAVIVSVSFLCPRR